MQLFTVLLYALGAVSFVEGAGPTTRQTCSTTWGKTSKKTVPSVQTSNVLQTQTATIQTCKTTKTTSVIPAPTTVTSTVWKTETRTINKRRLTTTTTITTINTSILSRTGIVTSVISTTRTLTTSETSTSTVPTPAGFTAVADTPGYMPKRRRDTAQLGERDEPADKAPSLRTRLEDMGEPLDRRQAKSTVNKFPQKVVCTKWITSTTTRTTSTCTRTPTKTVTMPRQTSTSLITKTRTTTKTVTPARRTKTFTVTQQTTVTQGEVTTTSTTSIVATETEYAACATNNIVSTLDGDRVTNMMPFMGTIWNTLEGDLTPLECCIKCFQSATCLASSSTEGRCAHGEHDMTMRRHRRDQPWTCRAGGGDNPDGYFYANGAGPEMFVSNGPCGRWAPSYP
ncbi:hypothetical protein NLU13_9964 [Sarocladium strictum]|uniref:Apple domain-containing protein n=1 Tax=Sarocladium strictum TaxID=5046 RepID=A0AA39G8J5_SARSR|nr:hypothetical protein NLU13_9964 [Sarocladium strictum]